VKIRLRPDADVGRLKDALREGGAAKVLKVARSLGDAAPTLEEIPRWSATKKKRPKQKTGRTRVAECYGKKRYKDEESAKRTKRTCEAARETRLRAYACHGCGGWHLTRLDAG
jgi:hypothetical protein